MKRTMICCRRVMEMIDYEEMYYKMVRATEQAINVLIQAQKECEQMYIEARDTPLVVFPGEKSGENTPDGQYPQIEKEIFLQK